MVVINDDDTTDRAGCKCLVHDDTKRQKLMRNVKVVVNVTTAKPNVESVKVFFLHSLLRKVCLNGELKDQAFDSVYNLLDCKRSVSALSIQCFGMTML